MQKVYLHGPNAGRTAVVGNVQFINGEAEVIRLSQRLERFYNVKDYPPENVSITVSAEDVKRVAESTQKDVEQVKAPEKEDGVDEKEKDEAFLKQVIEQKKSQAEKPDVVFSKDFDGKFFAFKKYVKELTGVNPKNKAEGDKILQKFKDDNGIE